MAAAPVAAADKVSFKNDVLPILHSRCQECHQPGGDGYEKSGLDLTSYEGLMKGTRFGPVVDPGNTMMSNLLVVVEGRASPAIRMPHDRKRLNMDEVAILRSWIKGGAKND